MTRSCCIFYSKTASVFGRQRLFLPYLKTPFDTLAVHLIYYIEILDGEKEFYVIFGAGQKAESFLCERARDGRRGHEQYI